MFQQYFLEDVSSLLAPIIEKDLNCIIKTPKSLELSTN